MKGDMRMDELFKISQKVYEEIKNLEPEQAIAVLEIVKVFIKQCI